MKVGEFNILQAIVLTSIEIITNGATILIMIVFDEVRHIANSKTKKRSNLNLIVVFEKQSSTILYSVNHTLTTSIFANSNNINQQSITTIVK